MVSEGFFLDLGGFDRQNSHSFQFFQNVTAIFQQSAKYLSFFDKKWVKDFANYIPSKSSYGEESIKLIYNANKVGNKNYYSYFDFNLDSKNLSSDPITVLVRLHKLNYKKYNLDLIDSSLLKEFWTSPEAKKTGFDIEEIGKKITDAIFDGIVPANKFSLQKNITDLFENKIDAYWVGGLEETKKSLSNKSTKIFSDLKSGSFLNTTILERVLEGGEAFLDGYFLNRNNKFNDWLTSARQDLLTVEQQRTRVDSKNVNFNMTNNDFAKPLRSQLFVYGVFFLQANKENYQILFLENRD